MAASAVSAAAEWPVVVTDGAAPAFASLFVAVPECDACKARNTKNN